MRLTKKGGIVDLRWLTLWESGVGALEREVNWLLENDFWTGLVEGALRLLITPSLVTVEVLPLKRSLKSIDKKYGDSIYIKLKRSFNKLT